MKYFDSSSLLRFLRLVPLCFVVSLLFPTFALGQMRHFTAEPEAEMSIQKTERPLESKPAEHALPNIKDNDVYLLTTPLYELLKRFEKGEVFDIEKELDRHIELRPNIFSAYFWSAAVKARRLLLKPERTTDDKKMLSDLNLCIEKAALAEKIPRYKTAGLFYGAMCEAGLALYHGIRGSYLKAHKHAVKGMDKLDSTLKRRPDLHGALLAKGLYNFYTGRFGFWTKLLLKLMNIKPGSVNLGLAQLKIATGGTNPFRYIGTIYATYAFAPKRAYRGQAFKLAQGLVKRHPTNYYAFLLRGYVYLKMGLWRKAQWDNEKARRMMPAKIDESKDPIIIADIFLIEVRIAYTKAMLDSDKAALHRLDAWAKQRRHAYADAPALAWMYLGHLHSFAGLDKKATACYKKMQTFDEAVTWIKDLGARYEKKPMRQRRRLNKKTAKKLKVFLQNHGE